MSNTAFLYGTVYHPERCADDAGRLEEDAMLMNRLHMNTVILTPETARYARVRVGGGRWTDELLSRLSRVGIRAVIEIPDPVPARAELRALTDKHEIRGFLITARDPERQEAVYHTLRHEYGLKEMIGAAADRERLLRGEEPTETDAVFLDPGTEWMNGTVAENGEKAGFVLDRARTASVGSLFITGLDPVRTYTSDPAAHPSRLMPPGLLTLAVCQAAAHGARGFFFREWRQPETGPDRYRGAVIRHQGEMTTRSASETEQVGRLLGELTEVAHAGIRAECAVLLSGEPSARPAGSFYSILRSEGLNADVIGRTDDLERYRVVYAPRMRVLSGEEAAAVRTYIKNGGIFIAGGEFAEEDASGRCYEGDLPHGLADVFGIRITDFDELPPGEEIPLRTVPDFRGHYHAGGISGILIADEAETVAWYDGGFFKDTPAVTRMRFGEGFAYYLAAEADDGFVRELCGKILRGEKETKRAKPQKLIEGLSVLRLTGDTAEYVVFQNFTENERRLPVDYNKLDILFGYDPLPGYGSMVLKISRKEPAEEVPEEAGRIVHIS